RACHDRRHYRQHETHLSIPLITRQQHERSCPHERWPSPKRTRHRYRERSAPLRHRQSSSHTNIHTIVRSPCPSLKKRLGLFCALIQDYCKLLLKWHV